MEERNVEITPIVRAGRNCGARANKSTKNFDSDLIGEVGERKIWGEKPVSDQMKKSRRTGCGFIWRGPRIRR